MAQRLADPEHLVSEAQRAKLEVKITECYTRMLASKEQGGNPFLFALSASKPHQLTKGWPGQDLSTAATDGKQYYWCPGFLDELTPDLVRVVMEHEAYHNVYFHCHADRMAQRLHDIWNIAVDYVVNTVILVDRTGAINVYGSHSSVNQSSDAGKVFHGTVGTAIELDDLLDVYRGKRPPPTGATCYADKRLIGKSADWIYDEIVDVMSKFPCPTCGANQLTGQPGSPPGPQPGLGGGKSAKGAGPGGQKPGKGASPGGIVGPGGQGGQPGVCPTCGAGHGAGPGGTGAGGRELGRNMDSHIPSAQSREEAIWESVKAADVAKAMGKGDMPAGLKEWLKELGEPTLRPADIIRMAMLKRRADQGAQKDWKRFRRRGLALRPKPEYNPRYYEMKPRWVAMLDTSGSHDYKSMQRGVKELKLVGRDAEGLIVPCDAQPYWDKATKISNIDDLRMVNATGRGGTVFHEFFKDLPRKAPGPWDVVVVITDGECDKLPMNLHPGCDVLWLITNSRVDYTPSFGRMIHLKD